MAFKRQKGGLTMAIIRATFFFKDDNDHGWTETIHTTRGDLVTAMIAATLLGQKRVELLGGSGYLSFIRVSDDLVKRDSLVNQISSRDGRPKSLANGASASANISLVIRMQANVLNRRTLYMRGIPQNILAGAGLYFPQAYWIANFAAWNNQLTTDGWAIRSRSGLVVQHVIQTISQDPATGRITFTTADAHGFVPNSSVIVKGVRGAVSANGLWNVFSVADPTHFTVNSNVLLQQWTGGGTAGLAGYVLNAIVNSQVMRASERKAGRFFDSPVGRRRVRRLR